jgi:rhodanese-related sulfurtransferase
MTVASEEVPVAVRSIFEIVEAAKQRIENLSVEALKTEMRADADLLLLDIRELQERVDLGTIPGARHVPRGMLEFWADPASPYFRDYFREDRRTVLFCAGGGRSALAADALREMGFQNVAHLEPGFGGWQKQGEPLEDVRSTSRWVRRTESQPAGER